jgi:hypothetical protein
VCASPDGPGDQRRASPAGQHRAPSVLLFRRYVTASALTRLPWRLRRYQSSPLLEHVERAGRINARRSSDELDQLLKLGSAELERDLVDATLMEQQDSCNNGLGHTLSVGPARIVQLQADVNRRAALSFGTISSTRL